MLLASLGAWDPYKNSAQGLGFRVQGLGFRVQVQGLGFRVQGLGFIGPETLNPIYNPM